MECGLRCLAGGSLKEERERRDVEGDSTVCGESKYRMSALWRMY